MCAPIVNFYLASFNFFYSSLFVRLCLTLFRVWYVGGKHAYAICFLFQFAILWSALKRVRERSSTTRINNKSNFFFLFSLQLYVFCRYESQLLAVFSKDAKIRNFFCFLFRFLTLFWLRWRSFAWHHSICYASVWHLIWISWWNEVKRTHTIDSIVCLFVQITMFIVTHAQHYRVVNTYDNCFYIFFYINCFFYFCSGLCFFFVSVYLSFPIIRFGIFPFSFW